MEAPKLFLTDYASYNEGTQFEFGHWVDLTDFTDAEEFFDYIREHFEKCDNESTLPCGTPREEIMFTDYAFFPALLYGESLSTEEVQKIYDYIEIFKDYDIDDPESLIELWNEYCSECKNGEDEVYENDDDFFETYFAGRITDAVRAAKQGEYNFSDPYVCFNGYANLDSMDSYKLAQHIEIDEIINYKLGISN